MIRIITDSTGDLSPEMREKLGVESLPLSVHFGNESFRDGVDITPAEFYSRLGAVETLPTTSQLNPDELAEAFKRHRANGDQVVGIFLSSALSGTFQSACIAREMAGEEGIYIVDSRATTFALGMLVGHAASLRDGGMGAAQLAQAIEELAGRLRLVAVVDTLKYLKMGGRISSATAAIGGILGISPVIALQDGKVESIGKARGRKAAFRWLGERVEQEDIDFSLPIAFGHTHCEQAMFECMEQFYALRKQAAYVVTGEIGSVIGTHAGPGAAGMAYFVKK